MTTDYFDLKLNLYEIFYIPYNNRNTLYLKKKDSSETNLKCIVEEMFKIVFLIQFKM